MHAYLGGKNPFETDLIRQELKRRRELSIMSIGPAGETWSNLPLLFDRAISPAIMESERLWARRNSKLSPLNAAKNAVRLKDRERFLRLAKELLPIALDQKPNPHAEGTVGGVIMGTALGGACR